VVIILKRGDIMLIGKDHKIESDNMNVTIYKRMVSKKSKAEYWKPIAYFATVKNALKEFVNMKLRDTELTDLKTVVQKQDELYAMIDNLTI